MKIVLANHAFYRRRIVFLIGAFFLCRVACLAQQNTSASPSEDENKSAFAHKVDSFIRVSGFNNGCLLISKGDSVLYENCKGYVNRAQREKASPSAPFHIASTSKTFTGMAILKLHQDSLLNIYDPVTKYIPNFPYLKVSIYHLLTHRSGIPYYANFLPRTRRKYYTNKDVVNHIIRYKPRLLFTPDTRFKYCNTNYALLAYIIERVSLLSYEAYLKKNFWDKYGLTHTFVLDSTKKIPQTTPSYTYRLRKYGVVDIDFIYGDKNIYSSVEDLARWNALLCDTNVFRTDILKLAYTSFSSFPNGSKKDLEKSRGYGLGWRIFYTNHYYQAVFHNGWWHGNKSLFLRIPELKYCIAAVNNTSSSTVYRMKSILSFLLPSLSEEESSALPND